MKKLLFVVLSIVGILAASNVLQNAQAQREKDQTALLLDDVRIISVNSKDSKDAKPAPSSTPCTMHVTQKVGLLFDAQQVLDLLLPGK